MHFLVPASTFLSVRMMGSAAFLTVQVAAPAAARDVGFEASAVGFISSCAFLGTMIGSPSAGPLVARLGGVRVMQAGLVAGGLSLALAAFGVPWLMLLAAFSLGLGLGPITPSGSELLMRFTPRRLLSFTFGLTQSAVPLGSALAGALVPAMAVAFGWRAGLYSVALLCLGLAALIHPLHRPLDASRDRSTRFSAVEVLAAVRLVLASPSLREVTVTASAFGAVQWCLGTFLVAYLAGEIGLPYVTAGLALTVAQIAGSLGRVAWGVLADVVGSTRAVLAGLGMAMAAADFGLALVSPAWPLAGLLVLCAVAGVTAIGWNGIYLSELGRLAPTGRAANVTGGSVFVFSLVTVIAPALFSLLIWLTGTYATGFGLLALVALAAALRLFRPEARARLAPGGGPATRPPLPPPGRP
ncbi:MAG: MFS transporter [Proteobacteria bacterium]|nr:MFS transporter [Pseudomonadota bacterium]